MTRVIFGFILAGMATPVLAHHEVVVATTMMPVMSGLALICSAGLVAWLKRDRKK